MVQQSVAPVKAATRPPPCTHLGGEVGGEERQRLGLGHGRRWRLCLHDEKPLGEAVCTCKGCGPKCRGYTLEAK